MNKLCLVDIFYMISYNINRGCLYEFYKKIVIIFLLVFGFIFGIYGIGILYGRVRTSYLINWHVTFPKPLKEEIIFSAGWSDSVYSDVLYYDNIKL